MATYSVGVSATFAPSSGGSITISEMTSLSWSGPSGLSKGRSTPWTDDAGEVSVSFLGNGPGTGDWNKNGTLTVTGGGMDISWPVMCGPVSYTATLNGFTQKSVTFKVLR